MNTSMTFLAQLKARVDIVAAAGMVGKTILAQTVSDDIKDARMELCNSCEFLFTPTNQCKKCGCFVKIKTGFAPFKCPIGKWGPITTKDTQ